jgi:NAD+ synthase
MDSGAFDRHTLDLDLAAEVTRTTAFIRDALSKKLKRRGLVVGLSGGIDSSVVAALAVAALGKERVLGLFMPEQDSEDDSLRLGRMLAESLGIDTVLEDLAPALAAVGCYTRRDEAIRAIIPGYGPGWRSKIVLPSVLDVAGFRLFSVVAQAPDGEIHEARLPRDAYFGVVAATNFKQRARKMLEYYHADRLNYAVAGTPNRLEYDQGFFVKNGDGAADVKPIAHLYKSQVYAMAQALGVPAEICSRPPTTDTYSMPQSQEEFFFSLPYDQMDLCLYGHDHQVPAADVASCLGLSEEQVKRVYGDIASKRRAAVYLHAAPIILGDEEAP